MEPSLITMTAPRILAARLRRARKARGLTQEQVAHILKMSRPTVGAIETGQRMVKAEELARLAEVYGCRVSDFVEDAPTESAEPFHAQFHAYRQLIDDWEQFESSMTLFERFCRNYDEIERIIGVTHLLRLPPEYPIVGLSVEQAAEAVSIAERHRLGLLDAPLVALHHILEMDIGLRVFFLPLQPQVLAASICTEQLGGCLAVNSLQTETLQRWQLARHYGYFLANRRRPVISFRTDSQHMQTEKRFADAFAQAFLMPMTGLARRFEILGNLGAAPLRIELALLSHYYGVTLPTLAHRLIDLRLLASDWERKVRGTTEHTLPQIEEHAPRNPFWQFPLRYRSLAYDAQASGLIDQEQYTQFLNTNPAPIEHIPAKGKAEQQEQTA